MSATANGAPTAYLRFQVNVPETIALKFTTGLVSPSQFGTEQIMFTLADGRKTYLPPIAADKIAQLGVRAGQPITVCKKMQGSGRGVEWVVEPQVSTPTPAPPPAAPVTQSALDKQLAEVLAEIKRISPPPAPVDHAEEPPDQPPPTLEQELAASLAAINKSKAKPPAQAAVPASVPAPASSGAASNMMRTCVMQAIAAAAEGEGYAKECSLSIQFTSEDVRAMAITIYINHAGGRA